MYSLRYGDHGLTRVVQVQFDRGPQQRGLWAIYGASERGREDPPSCGALFKGKHGRGINLIQFWTHARIQFPGISLNLQNGSTPELYLRRVRSRSGHLGGWHRLITLWLQATFIIPGIRNADQLASAIDTLGKIHGEYTTGKAPPPS